MFVCSKCYKQLIRLDGLIKSTGNLCDELQRIFQQRGPVRFKRLASESPQTPRLRPKSLIMDYEDPAQTSQSKSNVCQLAATPNSCPNISYPAVSVTPSNISQHNRFSLVMKAFPYVQFEPTKSSTPSKKKRIPNTVGSTVTDGVSKVSITVEFPSKTVRKELSAELSSLGKALVFGPDDRIARAVMKNPILNRSVANLVLKKLGEELNGVCARKNPSVLRKSAKDYILNFSLEKVCQERTPLFYGVLMTYANVKKETTWPPSIVVATSVLLKQRNTHMNTFATVVSLTVKNRSTEVSFIDDYR